MTNFTFKHLGRRKNPCLKAKGNESRGLVRFAVETLSRNISVCGDDGQKLLRSGKALLRIYETIRGEHRRVPLDTRLELLAAAKIHAAFHTLADGTRVPKHHALFHPIQDAHCTGNPAFF